ncbi:hypothetical protein HZA38_04800 [Candidatus Peregrinibacteria bacterium]|nr:hypothetical protein [Candidatus Peregrinibacteria bacterium]
MMNVHQQIPKKKVEQKDQFEEMKILCPRHQTYYKFTGECEECKNEKEHRRKVKPHIFLQLAFFLLLSFGIFWGVSSVFISPEPSLIILSSSSKIDPTRYKETLVSLENLLYGKQNFSLDEIREMKNLVMSLSEEIQKEKSSSLKHREASVVFLYFSNFIGEFENVENEKIPMQKITGEWEKTRSEFFANVPWFHPKSEDFPQIEENKSLYSADYQYILSRLQQISKSALSDFDEIFELEKKNTEKAQEKWSIMKETWDEDLLYISSRFPQQEPLETGEISVPPIESLLKKILDSLLSLMNGESPPLSSVPIIRYKLEEAEKDLAAAQVLLNDLEKNQ